MALEPCGQPFCEDNRHRRPTRVTMNRPTGGSLEITMPANRGEDSDGNTEFGERIGKFGKPVREVPVREVCPRLDDDDRADGGGPAHGGSAAMSAFRSWTAESTTGSTPSERNAAISPSTSLGRQAPP